MNKENCALKLVDEIILYPTDLYPQFCINTYRNHAKILWFVTNLYLSCIGHLASTTHKGNGIKL